LLRLISLNGENITQSLYRSHPVYPSLGRYLSYLKEDLGVEAELAKLDSKGSRFELLKALSTGKSHVFFENSVYIPMNSESKVWGFVKLKNSSKISDQTLQKALLSLNEVVPRNLFSEFEEQDNFNRIVALVLNVRGSDGYKLVLDHFYKDKYASFINLSEWINLKQPFSLKYLREFRNSLFYIHEVMDLTRSQRATLALYSMLPSSVQKNALVVTSKLSEDEIKKSLSSERGFLSAFLDKKVELDKLKPKRPLP
jgi:hypothetical protein